MAKQYRSVSLGRFDRIRGWHSLGKRLRLKSMGLTVATLPAGPDGIYPHPHSHALQEEVYVLLAGRGEIVVDGRVRRLKPGDIVAVEPAARRALRSSPRSKASWLMLGAVAGHYRPDDWTEYDEPAFPPPVPRTARKVRRAVTRAAGGRGGRRAARRKRGRRAAR